MDLLYRTLKMRPSLNETRASSNLDLIAETLMPISQKLIFSFSDGIDFSLCDRVRSINGRNNEGLRTP